MPDVAEYPPARHVLRDLCVTTEMGPGLEARAFLDVPDPLVGPGGTPHAGALATVVDMLGGGLAAAAAQPDWIATADLTLHLLPRRGITAIDASATVLRRGRTTIVVDVVLRGDGEPLGLAAMTFAVLPRRDGNPTIAGTDTVTRMTMALPDSGFTRPYAEAIGMHVDDGTATFTIADYVRNSLGAVQGGVMASAAVVAAHDALGADGGAPTAVVELQISYLALAKVGPVTARATPIDVGADAGTARVALVDGGAEELVTSIARVKAVAVP